LPGTTVSTGSRSRSGSRLDVEQGWDVNHNSRVLNVECENHAQCLLLSGKGGGCVVVKTSFWFLLCRNVPRVVVRVHSRVLEQAGGMAGVRAGDGGREPWRHVNGLLLYLWDAAAETDAQSRGRKHSPKVKTTALRWDGVCLL
jgi:hypothetical protein